MHKSARLVKNRSKKIGLPAGSLVYVGEEKTHQARISVTEFDENGFSERWVASPQELMPLKLAPTVTWINVDGVHDPALLGRFGEVFGLHPLMLEDILNTDQRPKVDLGFGVLYVVLKMLDYHPDSQTILTEQVSLVVGENWLITFQEEVGDEFDPVRERLRNGAQRLRSSGPDYLAYSLIDAVVDRYFLILEGLGTAIERLEDRLDQDETLTPTLLGDIHEIKRELIFLRKAVWPVRDLINTLLHLDTPLLQPTTQTYLRDVYDHTVQAIDALETYRDLLSSNQDLYVSILSHRMNEIIKVLTIISTVFIPLTFVAGIYGMNFKYMPELESPWGYPAVLGVMTLMIIGMLVFFRRQRWI